MDNMEESESTTTTENAQRPADIVKHESAADEPAEGGPAEKGPAENEAAGGAPAEEGPGVSGPVEDAVTKEGQTASECCDTCRGFDKKCFSLMIPSNVACCVVCEAREYSRSNMLAPGIFDPTATLRVGVCVPPWLRAELSERLLRALRLRIQTGVLDSLRSNPESGETKSDWCLVKNPLEDSDDVNTSGTGTDPEAAAYVLDLIYTSPFCDVVKKRRGRKRCMKSPPVNWLSRPLKLTVNFESLNQPIVYQGRYNKLARDVAQTKWINNDYTSIEQLLGAKAKEVHLCSEYNLIGSGREDVDVKMLGQGRPFLLVLKNSKILPPCRRRIDPQTQATQPIATDQETPLMATSYSLRDGDVLIHDLRLLCQGFKQTSQATKAFQETIPRKLKMYSAQVTTSKPVDLDAFNQKYHKILDLSQPLASEPGKSETVTSETVETSGTGSQSSDCVVIMKNSDSQYSIQSMPSVAALEVEQRTPLRVAHRRADLIRKRNIYSMRMVLNSLDAANTDSPIDNSQCKFTLEILGSAGLYIKEFVHSDQGRTNPSLAMLLSVPELICGITQLDVLNLLNVDSEFNFEEDP